MAALQKRKKKAAPRKARAFDEQHTGGEPVFVGWEDWDISKYIDERRRVSYYYQYHSSTPKLIGKIPEWMKLVGFTKEEIKEFKEGKHPSLGINHCAFAAARINGMPSVHPGVEEYLRENPRGGISPKAYSADIDAYLRDAVRSSMAKYKMGDDTAPVKKVISPIEKLRMKVDSLLLEQYDIIEDTYLIRGKLPSEDLDLLTLLQTEKIPPNICPYIKEFFQSRIDEMEDAKVQKEAYSNWKKTHITKAIKYWNSQLEIIDNYATTAKVTRKTVARAKKPTPVHKQIAKLKYQAKAIDIGLASIAPADIVSATILFLFNTKTRRLTVLHSNSKFTVSGSTIKNIDEDLSFCKTVRDPSILKDMIVNRKGYPAVAKQIHNDIKTMESKSVSGRTNDTTILLRAIC